ncbi:glycosyltransferase family 87 protein [Streptomyces sp. NBC_01565]|uniref:glycosyltransferase family 87 protein n=1 Tax=Streptomyces sp. NBC_01565 TaxID=2975881 RepID=UPI002B1CB45B|nr:glycosyltransferase family 87 protein [Streptomyces sp. NBC_01565]
MTRHPAPERSSAPPFGARPGASPGPLSGPLTGLFSGSLSGTLVTGPLLLLGVLCVALRIPVADALVHGFCAAEWHPSTAYPPFAAILFTPAAWLPAAVLKAVIVLGSAGLLALLILLSCRLAGLRARSGPVLAATIAGLWLEPLFQTPLTGQINLALACLAVWDLGRSRTALGKGFALGTAAGITLTPALLVPYLLLTGRVRAGLTALAAFTGTALLGLLVLPQASAEFWARHLPATGRALPLDWPWSHLWVWCVPLLAVLTRAARRRPAPVPAVAPAPPSRAGAGPSSRPAGISRSPAARPRP